MSDLLVVRYDPLLVLLSVGVAIMASYTGIALTTGHSILRNAALKTRVMNGALVIGGGIWSMHFIGMLAAELPVPMQYEALETLISVLTAVLLTEVGLYVVAFQPFRKWNLSLAGLFMGLGIAGMHYIGMSAMRGDFAIGYIPWGIALSLVMAVGTSTAAMWFAVRKRTLAQTAIVGIVLGIAISSMHYTGMLATRFYAVEAARPLGAPVMSSESLAIFVALAAFVICGLCLLISLPDKSPATSAIVSAVSGANDAAADAGPDHGRRIPVRKNGTVHYLQPDRIVSVSAQGHYTIVRDSEAQYFCDYSISALERMLGPELYVRSHRSHLVNLAYVAGIGRQGDSGFLLVRHAASEERVPVSRSKLEGVRLRLEAGVQSSA